jgi:hypothetical protein
MSRASFLATCRACGPLALPPEGSRGGKDVLQVSGVVYCEPCCVNHWPKERGAKEAAGISTSLAAEGEGELTASVFQLAYRIKRKKDSFSSREWDLDLVTAREG